MSSIPWCDDRVATLKQLWAGDLSASEIAETLGGVTRNAVLGKLHRLGLLGSRPRIPLEAKRVRPRRTRIGRRRASAPRRASAGAVVAPPDWPGEIASVEGLGAHHCRWPIADPRAEGFSFCGRRADRGPYCPAHMAVAFLSP
jgi:GcrA cell cycle regulator